MLAALAPARPADAPDDAPLEDCRIRRGARTVRFAVSASAADGAVAILFPPLGVSRPGNQTVPSRCSHFAQRVTTRAPDR